MYKNKYVLSMKTNNSYTSVVSNCISVVATDATGAKAWQL